MVQFSSGNPAIWHRVTKEVGGLIVGYLGRNSYLAQLSETATASLGDQSWTSRIVAFPPDSKIGRHLSTAGERVTAAVALFRENADSTFLVANFVRQLGGVVERIVPENAMLVVTADTATLEALAALPQVRAVDSWGAPRSAMDNVRLYTGAAFVHGLGFDGTGVVGEVMDDGIYQNHPEFVGRLLAMDCPPPGCDSASHGTSVFGIAFATGVNPQAEGMLSDRQPPPGGPSGVFASWDLSRTQAALNLVNNWGGVFQSHSWFQNLPHDREYTLASQENDEIVFDLDISMTQAMGNEGYTLNDWGQPGGASQEAMAKNVIAVGAVCHYNDASRTTHSWCEFHGLPNTPDDDHAPGFGPASDGRVKPDLSGPYDAVYTTTGATGYRPDFGGTSAATPVVAGAVGLVNQLYRDNAFGNNPTGVYPRPSTVKALLIANAYQYDLATQAKRCEQGWGTPDLQFMYTRRMNHLIIDEGTPLTQGQSVGLPFAVESAEPLKITLVWTDPPGTTDSSQHLINDLDLLVMDPLGNVYWGNYGLTGDTSTNVIRCPGASQWSVPGGTRDTKNNVENVFVESPTWGLWTIQVRAHTVPLDGNPSTPGMIDQPFSLVVSSGSPIADNEPPLKATLTQPGCGTSTSEERPTFAWSQFTDPAPSSGLRWFHFELGSDQNFPAGSIIVHDHPKADAFTPLSLDPGTYYWRVKPEDNAGNTALEWSTPPVCHLTVMSNPVQAPGGLTLTDVVPNIVRLAWDQIPAATAYRVYTSQDRFAPYSSWTQLAETDQTSFDALGHLSDGLPHYYIVRSVAPTGMSRASSMGAKIELQVDFDSSWSNIYRFSLPYHSKYTKASDISDDLTASRISVVSKWNPATQTSILWYYFRDEWRGDDFLISPGDGLYIGAVSSFSWPILGTDTEVVLQFSLGEPPNGNWVSLPYSSTYSKASDLVHDIEGSTDVGASTRIVEVSKWHNGVQALIQFVWTPTGWFGTDFRIDAADSVYFRITSNFNWQPRLLTPEVP